MTHSSHNRSLSGDVTLMRIEVHLGYRRHLGGTKAKWCSVFGELSFPFTSKWYILVVLTSAIVNCMIEKVKTSPRKRTS